ncbi:hypothetical protein FC961_00140 [Clostridium botulinum]|nr:hypothetical protein [Clostridium botulinum]NFO90313.1 hypothetical protein [Clostridium botulinum]
MAKTRGLNRCCYGSERFYTRCDFNIYQSIKGTINMLLGSKSTELTLQQINELKIDVYTLQDFDYELFKKVYKME